MTTPYTSADFGNDWNTERNFIDQSAEQILQRPPRHKFTFIGERSRHDQAVGEAQQDNAHAVEVESRRYDEQNK
jgi:hypothetical protein